MRMRLVVATCFTILFSTSALRAGIEPTPFRTGLFSVADGQGVRISIVNAGNSRSVINPCFKIWDIAGRVLAETDAGRIRGGRGASAAFGPIPNDGRPRGGPVPNDGRVMVRVEVALLPIPEDGLPVPEGGVPVPDDGGPVPEDGLTARDRAMRRTIRNTLPTLEVFDLATGRTQFTIPFARVAFNPQPEPPDPTRTPGQ